MDPLHVTFRLDTPMVAPGYPIHLDALVAYALTQQGVNACLNPGLPIRDLAANLPFAKHEQDGEWVWQASALTPTVVGDQSIRYWTRRTDPYDLTRRIMDKTVPLTTRTQNAIDNKTPYACKIDTNRGILKNMFQFYPTAEVFQLEAWCIGDIDQIESLIAPEQGLLTHLGKRTRLGHGRIVSVEIEYDEAAREGWKNRVLPWKETDDYLSVTAAFKPPYWAHENRRQAFMPSGL